MKGNLQRQADRKAGLYSYRKLVVNNKKDFIDMKGKQVNLKTKKAAKEHQCNLCGSVIGKGEPYTSASGLPTESSYPITQKYCIKHEWPRIHQNMLVIMGY
jgi:hypothetical protein